MFELLVINIQDYILPNFFKLVIDKFSDDAAMVFISKAISSSFSTAFVRSVYRLVCENGTPLLTQLWSQPRRSLLLSTSAT